MSKKNEDHRCQKAVKSDHQMDRRIMESTNVKNLRHLYDLTHVFPETPELGSIYTSKLHKVFNKKNLQLPNQITNGVKFCSNCETLLIPGINMSMRINYTKTKKSRSKDSNGIDKKLWKPRDRNLVYKCLSCNHTTKFELLKPETDPKEKIVQPEESMETMRKPFVATWNPNEEKKKSTAKERAKKRKKNNLSNLLSSKKAKEEQDKKKSSLLSLSEFMKS